MPISDDVRMAKEVARHLRDSPVPIPSSQLLPDIARLPGKTGVKHGTWTMYVKGGCTCDECREWNAERNRKTRQKKRQTKRLA